MQPNLISEIYMLSPLGAGHPAMWYPNISIISHCHVFATRYLKFVVFYGPEVFLLLPGNLKNACIRPVNRDAITTTVALVHITAKTAP